MLGRAFSLQTAARIAGISIFAAASCAGPERTDLFAPPSSSASGGLSSERGGAVSHGEGGRAETAAGGTSTGQGGNEGGGALRGDAGAVFEGGAPSTGGMGGAFENAAGGSLPALGGRANGGTEGITDGGSHSFGGGSGGALVGGAAAQGGSLTHGGASTSGGSSIAGMSQGGSAGQATVELRGEATASSWENDAGPGGGVHPPSDATDGDETTTRWCAADKTVPQWWQLDLGSPHSLSRIELVWEYPGQAQGHSYGYVIDAFDDPNHLPNSHLIDRSSNPSMLKTQIVSFPNGTAARYLRVTVVSLPPDQPQVGTMPFETWASLFEVRVFGR